MSFSAFLAVVFAVNLVCAVIAASVAGRQGRDPFSWVLVCAVLGPFGLIALFALRPGGITSPEPRIADGLSTAGGPRVLVPVDGSEHSLAAVRYAVSSICEPRITLLAVLPLERGEVVDGEPSPRRHEMEEEANAHLDAAASILHDAGLQFRRETAFGDAAAQIIEIARDGDFEMIVMGRRGRGGLAKALLGSVSDAVVKNGGTPVTVVG